MSTVGRRWIFGVALAFAVMAGAGYALQWHATGALRRELALLQEENRVLERLRTENARLKAESPPAAEVERLRADHAALLRLRLEIEKMQRRMEARTVNVDRR